MSARVNRITGGLSLELFVGLGESRVHGGREVRAELVKHLRAHRERAAADLN